MPPGIPAEITIEPIETTLENHSDLVSNLLTEFAKLSSEEAAKSWGDFLPELIEKIGEMNAAVERATERPGELNWDEDGLRKISNVLNFWSLSDKKAVDVEHTHPRDRGDYDEIWEEVSGFCSDRLRVIFDTTALTPVGWILRNEEVKEDTRLTDSLFMEQGFSGKGTLAELISYRIWLAWELTTHPCLNDKIEKAQEKNFRDRKENLASTLVLGLTECVKGDNNDSIERVLGQLMTCDSRDIADKVFLSQELSLSERQRYTVSYINTFGYMAFVEMFSPLAAENENNKRLFELFSGQEVVEVMSELDKVYDQAMEDFIKHYDVEVTTSERILIAEVLKEECGVEFNQAKVLDLAAGFGRISGELLSAGCGEVTAIEPHEGLFGRLSQIKGRFSNFIAIKGGWNELTKLNINKVDLGVCVGRSLPHANTWEKLLTAFSQMSLVADKWLIDYPDPSIGVYADFAEKLEMSLSRTGVKPDKAKMIYDSPDGKHFFHRMVVGKEQLQMVGDLLGLKIKEVRSEFVGQDSQIKNTYYLMEIDQEFDMTQLCGDKLVAITCDLGMRKPGTNFNLALPQWGMSLGQALIHSFESPARRSEVVRRLIEKNKRNGIPRVVAEFDKKGVLHLEVGSIGGD